MSLASCDTVARMVQSPDQRPVAFGQRIGPHSSVPEQGPQSGTTTAPEPVQR
jgi:hypothetical protein